MSFEVVIDRYLVRCQVGALPYLYNIHKDSAILVDEIDLPQPELFTRDQGDVCFFGIGLTSADSPNPDGWPQLVVAQSYSPDETCGFAPGALIVPETDIVFIGAGERILAYQLTPPRRLWQDSADTGFWHWRRHGNFVVMSAELELAAWTIHGEKLWTTFVEPPWDYRVTDNIVRLDVMGNISRFALMSGPSAARSQRVPEEGDTSTR